MLVFFDNSMKAKVKDKLCNAIKALYNSRLVELNSSCVIGFVLLKLDFQSPVK